MPLPRLVLHLLHASLEDVLTSVTPGSKLCIIAGATVDPVSFGAKLLVHQRGSTFAALEAGLMPMFLLVAQILAVNANDLATLVTVVGEDTLVTFDAVGMVISQHISNDMVMMVS